MKYKDAKRAIYATGNVPDGYFGSVTPCGFAFDPETGKTIVVHKFGFHSLGLPVAVDANESKWLVQNHPSARHCKINPEESHAP